MIWDHEAAGSSPACSTTYSLFTIHYSLNPGTPERRGRGGRNPTASPKAEQCAPAQGEALPM